MKVNRKVLSDIISNALREDLGSGDLTTQAIISRQARATGLIRAKANGIICGQEAARMVFSRLDRGSRYHIVVPDGKRARAGQTIAEVRARLGPLLSGERTALNFLMHLSGIATLTAQYVAAIKGLSAKVLDTRKTSPGLRLLEKYAVRTGGGDNHRIGLFDMYLIKDNHIDSAGSIARAIERCLRRRSSKAHKIEVETRTLAEVREARQYPIDRIMLDNMAPRIMAQAVRLIRLSGRKIEIEASGNVNLRNIRRIARTGVDFISVGKLTHSAPALDLSLDIRFHEKTTR